MKYDIESIKKRKNTEKKIKTITNILLVIVIYNIILVMLSCLGKINTPSIFGYKAYNITTESMKPTINLGDIVIIKECIEQDLKTGDIITFHQTGEIITHRIVNIEEKDGKKDYITKGDNNNVEDSNKVNFEDIEGKKVLTIPYLGSFISLLENKIVFLFLVLILLLIYLYKIIKEEKKENRREKKEIEKNKKFN